MADEIIVRIVPGCPTMVLVETEEDKELVKAVLGNTECGCLVRSEAAEVAIAEAEQLAEEGKVEEALAKVKEAEELAEETPVCSLEPNVPWKESVCGVVAEEAGRLAAERVMVRLREEGLIQ